MKNGSVLKFNKITTIVDPSPGPHESKDYKHYPLPVRRRLPCTCAEKITLYLCGEDYTVHVRRRLPCTSTEKNTGTGTLYLCGEDCNCAEKITGTLYLCGEAYVGGGGGGGRQKGGGQKLISRRSIYEALLWRGLLRLLGGSGHGRQEIRQAGR